MLLECKVSSLNMSNHFILETADSLFHWKGPKADITKLKFAVMAIARLRKERLRKVKVVSMKVSQTKIVVCLFVVFPLALLVSKACIQPDDTSPEFWNALGGTLADVSTEPVRETDWERIYESSARFLILALMCVVVFCPCH